MSVSHGSLPWVCENAAKRPRRQKYVCIPYYNKIPALVIRLVWKGWQFSPTRLERKRTCFGVQLWLECNNQKHFQAQLWFDHHNQKRFGAQLWLEQQSANLAWPRVLQLHLLTPPILPWCCRAYVCVSGSRKGCLLMALLAFVLLASFQSSSRFSNGACSTIWVLLGRNLDAAGAQFPCC